MGIWRIPGNAEGMSSDLGWVFPSWGLDSPWPNYAIDGGWGESIYEKRPCHRWEVQFPFSKHGHNWWSVTMLHPVIFIKSGLVISLRWSLKSSGLHTAHHTLQHLFWQPWTVGGGEEVCSGTWEWNLIKSSVVLQRPWVYLHMVWDCMSEPKAHVLPHFHFLYNSILQSLQLLFFLYRTNHCLLLQPNLQATVSGCFPKQIWKLWFRNSFQFRLGGQVNTVWM